MIIASLMFIGMVTLVIADMQLGEKGWINWVTGIFLAFFFVCAWITILTVKKKHADYMNFIVNNIEIHPMGNEDQGEVLFLGEGWRKIRVNFMVVRGVHHRVKRQQLEWVEVSVHLPTHTVIKENSSCDDLPFEFANGPCPCGNH